MNTPIQEPTERIGITIVDDNGLCSSSQIKLLQNCASLYFMLEEYKSLADILNSLGVKVCICKGIIEHDNSDFLKETEDFWRSVLGNPDASEEERHEGEINLYTIRQECECPKTLLRGRYLSNEKTIELFPEEMMAETEGAEHMEELLVSTLVHETMHAYFNRPGHEGYPYAYFVEEPLAEFGMLLYLYKTGSCFYKWAYNDVAGKKSCYHHGAQLMDQYIAEDFPSAIKQYLVEYKIGLDQYAMLSFNYNDKTVTLPKRNTSIAINGLQWKNILGDNPPRYCYDKATNTLYLDGDWSRGRHHNWEMRDRRMHNDAYFMIDHWYVDFHCPSKLSRIYLADNFTISRHHQLEDLLSEHTITVSPANKNITIVKGVAIFKQDNTPVLRECGDGLYKICRNGKWGVVDTQLTQIVPCKYDSIWGDFDKNDLIEVRNNSLHGLVNKNGEEQVPVKYTNIDENDDGTYTVKQDGKEFKIDKFGNKIE